MALEHWICPYCNFAQVVPDAKSHFMRYALEVGDIVPRQVQLVVNARGCSNTACRQLAVAVYLHGRVPNAFDEYEAATLASKQLLPKGRGKPQPSYIPRALREDYTEACAIADDSPKAAATLVRRCLQGMIRDFAGITGKKTLYAEIEALRALVDEGRAPGGVTAETVEAIDAVRGIGNIGAHMEHDIDRIVDVEPGEAQALIELVEMLFAEWYVARHARQERLANIRKIAAEKEAARKGLPAPDTGNVIAALLGDGGAPR